MMLDQEATIPDEQQDPDGRHRPGHRRVRRHRRLPGAPGAGLSPGGGGRLGALAAPPPRGVRRARPLAAARLVLRGPGRDRVVLVDTGVGGPGAPGATWIGTPGRLPQELAGAGVELDEIDLVVLTHLHLDHIGWNLAWDGGRPRPRFPRASYLVQRSDWELFASRDEDAREAFDRCVAPLQALGVAELLEGDRTLDAELSLLHTLGTLPAPRACWSARERRRRCSGATRKPPGPGRRADWGPGSDVMPEVARAPGAGSWTSSRPRACGWPRPTSRSRSAP